MALEEHTGLSLVPPSHWAAAGMDSTAGFAATAAGSSEAAEHHLMQLRDAEALRCHIHNWHTLLLGVGPTKAKGAPDQQAAEADHMLAVEPHEAEDWIPYRDRCASWVAATRTQREFFAMIWPYLEQDWKPNPGR